jgi:hypothetical protein
VYLEYWGLKVPPFENLPNPDFLYFSPKHEEALTHHRPHRKRMLPHKAVQKIVQTQKVQFHQRLLKVMIEELSVFSLNSMVRLNSNAIGRVAETTPGQPLRPVVQLIFDAEGHEIMEDRYISLKEFPLLYIVDEVEESELSSNQ